MLGAYTPSAASGARGGNGGRIGQGSTATPRSGVTSLGQPRSGSPGSSAGAGGAREASTGCTPRIGEDRAAVGAAGCGGPVGGASSTGRAPQQLTREALLAATTAQRAQREGIDQFLARVTHLQLQGQRLGPYLGEPLQMVTAVTVLYAYDNLLSSLVGMEHLRRLQMLYLQNNRLTSMAGIESLTQLRKLHLGHNRLMRIEGLEELTNLEELYVPHQRPARGAGSELPSGEGDASEGSLEFCPSSVAAVAPTLQVLDAAGNRLTARRARRWLPPRCWGWAWPWQPSRCRPKTPPTSLAPGRCSSSPLSQEPTT